MNPLQIYDFFPNYHQLMRNLWSINGNFGSCSFHQQTDCGAQQDAYAVGKEVEPLARTRGGAVGLKEFYESTQQDHTHDGQEHDFTPLDDLVMAQVLKPDDAARATIHDKVRPLVDELDMVKGCLREKGSQREHPDEQDAEEREWIFPYKSDEKVHLFFYFYCKSKKNFILLQAL